MTKLEHFISHIPAGLTAFGILAMGVFLGLLVRFFLRRLLMAINTHQERILAQSAIEHYKRPGRFFFPLLVISLLMPLITLPPAGKETLQRLVEISLLISFSWMLIQTVNVVEDYVRAQFVISKSDNIRERRILTQLQFVRRIVILTIGFFTVALVLMSFETVRKIGTGLITSAGIASVIIGFAAQRSIANLLAGLQLAFSQPIRIDDVLIVEGEYGRVEEITFTYVVLGLWDQRRLIVPLNYFIEKPFQNWTRASSQLLGTVFIYTDYSLPVEAVRAELKRLVEPHPLWDKRVCVLHVTEAKERTMELRALVSATDSGAAFDLRADVREGLVRFIQQNYPESLPKTRSVIDPEFLAVATPAPGAGPDEASPFPGPPGNP
jgi:small-conductance mechanosensitive channel